MNLNFVLLLLLLLLLLFIWVIGMRVWVYMAQRDISSFSWILVFFLKVSYNVYRIKRGLFIVKCISKLNSLTSAPKPLNSGYLEVWLTSSLVFLLYANCVVIWRSLALLSASVRPHHPWWYTNYIVSKINAISTTRGQDTSQTAFMRNRKLKPFCDYLLVCLRVEWAWLRLKKALRTWDAKRSNGHALVAWKIMDSR